MKASKDIQRLIEIMAALRTPVTGCPWDLEQNFKSIAPYTIEEAYEVADAIAREDMDDLRDELGDLLLQVVYHSRMAEEQGAFKFGDVVEGVTGKMIRRHPHVFGDEVAEHAGSVDKLWERIKAEERARKGEAKDISLLAEVPVGHAALTRAVKLQSKAAKVGFDWPTLAPVFAKLKEEIAEFEEVAIPADPRGDDISENKVRIEEELGDLLFVMANIARHLKINPEVALQAANGKFTRRFRYIEEQLAAKGSSPGQSTLEEMDALWDEVRVADKAR